MKLEEFLKCGQDKNVIDYVGRLQKQNELLMECVTWYSRRDSWSEVETNFGLIKACVDRSDENAILNGTFKVLEITRELSENYDVTGGKRARECLAKLGER